MTAVLVGPPVGSTRLIPAASPCATLPPSAAPKRDHDEWLVRGRPGGGRVAVIQAESTSGMTRFAGDAATERDGGAMPAPPRIGSCRARAAGRSSRDGPKGSLPAKTLRSRDAARDAPGPSCHTPKIPAGRRGGRLVHLRTTRVRPSLAGPASFFETSGATRPSDASCCPDDCTPTVSFRRRPESLLRCHHLRRPRHPRLDPGLRRDDIGSVERTVACPVASADEYHLPLSSPRRPILRWP